MGRVVLGGEGFPCILNEAVAVRAEPFFRTEIESKILANIRRGREKKIGERHRKSSAESQLEVHSSRL